MKTIFPLLLVALSLLAAPAARATGLTFSFANGTVSGDTYTFDVMVQSNTAGALLGDMQVYINYNTAAFGMNVAGTGKATIGKGSLLNPYYSLNVNNNAPDRISIAIMYNLPDSPELASSLSASPQQLLSVTLTIEDPNEAAGLSFWLEGMDGQQFTPDRAIFTPVNASNTDQNVLPVELSSFSAMLDQGEVALTWTTASETNNAGFEIEHAAPSDAERFERIGFVAGQGTTSSTSQYSFRASTLEYGTHRFRLKQIDFDGTFAYSPVVEVVVELAESFELSPAYPNPFNPQTSFNLSLREGQQVHVVVFNTLGQRVAILHDGFLNGGQVHPFTFEAGALPSGLYFIRAIGEHFTATRQVSLIK